MGPGSFDSVWTGDSSNSITLYTNEDNTYNMDRLWLGYNDT